MRATMGRASLTRMMWFGFLCSVLSVSLGCASERLRAGGLGNWESDRQIGPIQLVNDLRFSTGVKTMVAAYGFSANGVTSSVAKVVYGAGISPRNDGTDFRLTLVDAGGQILKDYTIRNPRRLLVERKGLIEEEEVYYVAVFPFSPRAAQVRVLDRRGKALAVTELGPVLREFCDTAQNDEDCADVPP